MIVREEKCGDIKH